LQDDESGDDEGGRSSYAALDYDDEAEAGSWDASTPAAGAPAAAFAVASGERLVKPARAQPQRAGEEPPRWSYTDSTEVGELKARRCLVFACLSLLLGASACGTDRLAPFCPCSSETCARP
jgi:hypothetical protein